MAQPEVPSPEGDAEERRLIDRSAAGDQEAFRQLVLRHHRLVINVAFRALGELSLAEDVAQDVFIKVHNALASYRHDKPFNVRHAIANLPPHYRDTIALQAFGELSYDEIARALDIPLGTVMSRLNGAKRLLRERLGDLVSPWEEANTA
ncbi:MAG: hypothetical protein E6J32_08370 [Chloroflexi bacterium]|nr:MAG: hypothetical protein E6J32_08370 [Chloroflexota bacterium]